MGIQRMDHVGVVVDDLQAAIEFFVELGMEVEGEMSVEGEWVDRVVGLDAVRVDIAMVRTPDGHSKLELTKFRNPTVTTTEPSPPPNTLGLRRLMFAVDASTTPSLGCWRGATSSSVRSRSTRTSTGSATCAGPTASSWRWPSSSTEAVAVLPPAPEASGGGVHNASAEHRDGGPGTAWENGASGAAALPGIVGACCLHGGPA